MKFADNKRGLLKYIILVKNNFTKKGKSCRFEEESIKSEKQLLELIKKQLEEHYKEEK